MAVTECGDVFSWGGGRIPSIQLQIGVHGHGVRHASDDAVILPTRLNTHTPASTHTCPYSAGGGGGGEGGGVGVNAQHAELLTGQRVRVEGLSKSPHYNGLFGSVELWQEGGRYQDVRIYPCMLCDVCVMF